MKIEFTKGALDQCNILYELKTAETGFIFGTDLGKYKIIDNLFALRFNRKNLDHFYQMVFNHFGEHLIGVFFVNTAIFLNDWFLQNIIIQIKNHESSVFLYHFDTLCQEKRLEQIMQS